MTNWQSPALIFAETLSYVKFLHFLGGLYIWEFVLHLEFDFTIFSRERAFRPSFLLYLGARWFPLVIVIMQFALYDSDSSLDCGVYVPFLAFFSYGGFLFASSLIVLRVVEIWERNKIVLGISATTWLTNLGACIYCVAVIHGRTVEGSQFCWASNITDTKYNILFIAITNFVLLLLMLTGLLRCNNREKGDIWHVLSAQGVPWVVVLTIAAIPPLVFIFLDLNGVMDMITQIPALVLISICASRIYRGHLVHRGSTKRVRSSQISHGGVGPLEKFEARRGTTFFSASGVTQGTGQVFVMESLTPASDGSLGNVVEKEKVVTGTEEAV